MSSKASTTSSAGTPTIELDTNLDDLTLGVGWEGETAFLQVDGAYAWVDTARAHPNGLNLAGGPQPDARFGVPVDAVVAHTASSVLLEIGSTLDEHACDESFGIDDVALYVH